MAFGQTPLDTSSPPLPMSSAVPDGSTTPYAIAGGPSYSDSGNTKVPVSMYIKDGNDITLGLTTQTKATDGSVTSWSVIQLLKGILDKLFNGTLLVQTQTGTTGGSTPFHAISAATTNDTNVKNAAGLLYSISISNTNAAARFFKLYDKSTTPSVGTDTPKRTIQIPANATVIQVWPNGLAFTSGIGFGYTTGLANNDTGATGTDASLDLDYK